MNEGQYSLLLIVCAVISGTMCLPCQDVPTSEGVVTLEEGMYACSPLEDAQGLDDIGKNYVQCVHGKAVQMSCPPGLRFDGFLYSCNWPYMASCRLTGTTTETPTETTATTWRPVTPTRPAPTGQCSRDNCKLPDCFCFGSVPSNIPIVDTPMFIMLTYNGEVTDSLYKTNFQPVLVDKENQLYNPSGCRTKSAVYVSQENTDYSAVRAILEAGNEIGYYDKQRKPYIGFGIEGYYLGIIDGIRGLKDEMLNATRNQTLVNSILGFRTFNMADDMHFDILHVFDFLYDTSAKNVNIYLGLVPLWPYTLDFGLVKCIASPCKTRPYPGIWEVPLNLWSTGGTTHNDSFHKYFYPVKVPMQINTDYYSTKYYNSYPNLIRWLQDVLKTYRDVWLVTPIQLINWMKNPLTNAEMIAKKWGC